MTEWGLVAAFGIPAALLAGIALTAFWHALGKEPDEPGPKMHPHTIQYLANREKGRNGK